MAVTELHAAANSEDSHPQIVRLTDASSGRHELQTAGEIPVQRRLTWK
jgi:hypothetical protein